MSGIATLKLVFAVGLALIFEPQYNSETGRIPPQEVMRTRIVGDTGLSFLTNAVVLHLVERDVIVDPQWVAEVVLPKVCFETVRDEIFSYNLFYPETDFVFDDFIDEDIVGWWIISGDAKFKHAYKAPSGARVVVYVVQNDAKIHLFICCSYD